MLKAPWTDDEVAALNAFQANRHFHPYTCGGEKCRQDLIATTDGWKCPSCGYTQDWAHQFSVETGNRLPQKT